MPPSKKQKKMTSPTDAELLKLDVRAPPTTPIKMHPQTNSPSSSLAGVSSQQTASLSEGDTPKTTVPSSALKKQAQTKANQRLAEALITNPEVRAIHDSSFHEITKSIKNKPEYIVWARGSAGGLNFLDFSPALVMTEENEVHLGPETRAQLKKLQAAKPDKWALNEPKADKSVVVVFIYANDRNAPHWHLASLSADEWWPFMGDPSKPVSAKGSESWASDLKNAPKLQNSKRKKANCKKAKLEQGQYAGSVRVAMDMYENARSREANLQAIVSTCSEALPDPDSRPAAPTPITLPQPKRANVLSAGDYILMRHPIEHFDLSVQILAIDQQGELQLKGGYTLKADQHIRHGDSHWKSWNSFESERGSSVEVAVFSAPFDATKNAIQQAAIALFANEEFPS